MMSFLKGIDNGLKLFFIDLIIDFLQLTIFLNEKNKDGIVHHLGFEKESYQEENHTSVNLKK
jgi:hypothetical protein